MEKKEKQDKQNEKDTKRMSELACECIFKSTDPAAYGESPDSSGLLLTKSPILEALQQEGAAWPNNAEHKKGFLPVLSCFKCLCELSILVRTGCSGTLHSPIAALCGLGFLGLQCI